MPAEPLGGLQRWARDFKGKGLQRWACEVQVVKAPAVRALLCADRDFRQLASRALRALAWRSLPEEDLADEFAVYVSITNR